MLITPAALIRVAKDYIFQVARTDVSILAVYLTGSVLTDAPLLGGTTDIDLVVVHKNHPPTPREVIPVSPEVHLDIKHNHRSEYERPRELRVHPWLGPEMWDPMLLHEVEPFFEYVQAGVREKFHDPVNLLQRSRTNLVHARQIAGDLVPAETGGPANIFKYLKAVNHIANAIAILNGPVLAERRLLLQFPALATAAGHPEFTGQLLYLLGDEYADNDALLGFLSAWEETYLAATGQSKVDSRIHQARLAYYRRAFEAMIEDGNAPAALWPLLFTWTLSALAVPESMLAGWASACKFLGLVSDGMRARLEALNAFLDQTDELLNSLAEANGLDAIYRDGRRVY